MAKKQELKFHPFYAMAYWKIVALFEGDKEIENISLDDATKTATIVAKTVTKYEMLKKYIKPVIKCTEGAEAGDSLKVNVKLTESNTKIVDEINLLFKGNPYFRKCGEIDIPSPIPGVDPMHEILCEMENKTVHYFSDNMFNPGKWDTTLAETICMEILKPELLGFAITTHKDGEEPFGESFGRIFVSDFE